MREVEIELDKPRKLRFGIADIQEFSKFMGDRTIAEMISRASTIDAWFIVAGLFYGLRHEDGKISYRKCQQLVDDYIQAEKGTYLDLTTSLVEALNAATGFSKNGAKQEEGDG